MKRYIITSITQLNVICSVVCILISCQGGDDPLILGGQVPNMAGRNAGMSVEAGVNSAGDEAGDEADMMAGMPINQTAGEVSGGREIEVVCEEVVDETSFASDIGPALIANCATFGCHNPEGTTNFNLPISNTDLVDNPLEGQLLIDTLAVVMGGSNYVIAGEPSMSVLLSKASTIHGGFITPYEMASTEYQALSTWIEDMLQCIEVEIPSGGEMVVGGEMMVGGEMVVGGNEGENTQIFCDLLPNGDPQNRAEGRYYEVFDNEVNTILTASCGRSGCHATSANGFWLQAADLPCSVPANFLMTQAYINFSNPNESPLLEAAYDPYHSGYTIFTGRTDPRFISLQTWVLLGFED